MRVAKQVIADSEEAFKANRFTGIMSLLKANDEQTYRYYCVFDEETIEPLRLTEAGALALLQACGYII